LPAATGKTLKALAYNPATESLVATLEDGTNVTADLSALLAQGESVWECAVRRRPRRLTGLAAADVRDTPCKRSSCPQPARAHHSRPHPASPSPLVSASGVSSINLEGTKLVITLVNGTKLTQELSSE
jgi:hypothetical protein